MNQEEIKQMNINGFIFKNGEYIIPYIDMKNNKEDSEHDIDCK